MQSKEAFDKSRILLILIGAILVGVMIYLFSQVKSDKVKDSLLSSQNLMVLFTVHSQNKPLFNEVLFYSPTTKKAAIIDIPTETGSLIASLSRVDALDAVFNLKDMKDYQAVVESLLGVPVPFHILLDLDQVEKVTDLLSGLEIFISNSVEEIDKTPMVLLPSGSVQLDGSKVKDFLSFSEEGETGVDKTARYQKFFQALMRKMGDQKELLQNGKVFALFASYFQTNMEEKGLKSFVTELSGTDFERMLLQRVMGTERYVDSKKLLFPHYNGNLLKETVRQVQETLGTADTASTMGVAVSVEIQNGTSRQGLATRTNQIFKSFGYEVVNTKNADDVNVEKTAIIDRKGNLVQAQKVADVIKCKNVISQEQFFNESEVDVTIILGKDFDGRYVRSEK